MKFENVFILSDMDGTLLDDNREIPENNRNAIDYFIKNGGLFSVATGRAKRSVELFLPTLKTSAPSIVHNGSLIVDLNTDTIIKQNDLPDTGVTLVEDVLDRFPSVGIEICLADDQYVARSNYFTNAHHKKVGLELKLKSYRDVTWPWLKLNLTAEHEILLDVMEYVTREYKRDIFAQFSMPHYYEVMAQGSSKGDSAIWLLGELNIDKNNYYAIGDGSNDLELIMSAGENSYAPSNAGATILNNAKNHLCDNNNGAIAELIELLDKKY